MKLSKKTTTKGVSVTTVYTITAVTPLEYDTLCKGLELLQESNEAEGLRAFNMLRNMDGLRKETTEGATV